MNCDLNKIFAFTIACILLIVAFSTITGCSKVKKKTSFYPKEYHFPDSNLANGKTFVYKSIDDTTNVMFHDSKIIIEGEKTYLIGRQYRRESTLDSEKYAMDGEMIESYMIMGKAITYKLKGTIVQDEIIDDGSRLGKAITKAEYRNGEFLWTIRNEEYFLKDTTINWHGQRLDCIKTKSTNWIDLTSKKYPSSSRHATKTREGYFAKGIGLIRYRVDSPGNSVTMELSEIRDMSTAK